MILAHYSEIARAVMKHFLHSTTAPLYRPPRPYCTMAVWTYLVFGGEDGKKHGYLLFLNEFSLHVHRRPEKREKEYKLAQMEHDVPNAFHAEVEDSFRKERDRDVITEHLVMAVLGHVSMAIVVHVVTVIQIRHDRAAERSKRSFRTDDVVVNGEDVELCPTDLQGKAQKKKKKELPESLHKPSMLKNLVEDYPYWH